MHRHTRSEAGSISSPRSSRAPSFSSERPSVTGSVTFQMPSSVRPAPAYIAASVASQTVTDHHNVQLREDIDPDQADQADQDATLGNALFSEPALSLLNSFLDHLLFAFLAAARSPSLTAIRPAVTDVLKPRLAREAMATADEELQGLLAGDDDDEEFPANDAKSVDKWDVEKVWKRTRLRIMVYTRLGELEDEDEERYVQQERGLSMDEADDEEAGLVSWASAIFLTSIVEYVAEQTLLISGQAAYARTSAKLKKHIQSPENGEEPHLERIVVEDFDVEKVALNSALGRLWRTWRKRVRSPITPLSPSRSLYYMSSFTSLHRRRISHDTLDGSIMGDGVPEMPEHKPTETEIAANIPLPISDNDINEIEVPGLAQSFEEDESTGTQTPIPRPQRPSSFIMLPSAETFRGRLTKERPVSLPPPPAQLFDVPAWSEHGEQTEQGSDEFGDELAQEHTGEYPKEHVEEIPRGYATTPGEEYDEAAFKTPMERFSDDESYIAEEHQESIRHRRDQQDDGEGEADADMVAFAASTGMGFGMSPISPVEAPAFDRHDDDVDTPTQSGHDDGPQVLQSKRVSVERTGPPGVVRTYSTRSSSLKSPVTTPAAYSTREGRSYLDDTLSEDEHGAPEAIGVAHTSNMPIRTTPSPPREPSNHDQVYGHGKHPSHGGYVEVLPRQTAPTTITARKSTIPEERPTPRSPLPRGLPPQISPPHSPQSPRRELQRKEVPRKELEHRDASNKETEHRDHPRGEFEQQQSPRREIEHRETHRKEFEHKETHRRETAHKDVYRKDAGHREALYKETRHGETSHREDEQQGAHRKDAEHRRTHPKETGHREAVRNDVQLPELSRKRSNRSETSRKEVDAIPSRARDDGPAKSRVPALAAVQETENWAKQPTQTSTPEKQTPRGSFSSGSHRKSNASHRSREAPVVVAERAVKPIEGSPKGSLRSRAEGAMEKASLQRISSSSTRSVSTSILHSGRDSDISLSGRPCGLSGRMSQEDREREFDSLVKEQDTIKYTLTPQNVRDVEEPPVVKRVEQPKPPVSSVTVYPRVNADRDSSFGSQHLPSRSTSRSKGPMQPPGRPVSTQRVGAKPLAREPRIQTESMRDFADFIRSTGPSADQERSPQPFVSFSPSPKPTNGSSSTIGALGRKLSVRQGASHSHSNSNDGSSPKPRVHMEPRSPAGQRSGQDDLIDFIRQGPPGANNGQHRIPRTVAPFRTTVDSDQFERMLDDNNTVESAYGSQVSTLSKQSNQTSNSRTGLLPSNVVQPAYSNTPQKLTGSMATSSEPHIQRTRRRVKDPYAIDVSDEEDDDLLTALPKSSRRQEESLMDFLNSNEPPPSNQPQPLVLNNAAIAAAKARNTHNINSASATSLSSSVTTVRNGGPSPWSPQPLSPQSSTISSNTAFDTPRSHKPKPQARGTIGARDSRVGRSGTNDLADFLRNSGPPEPPAPAPSTTIKKEEGKRLNARFWRKKIYSDMA